jgi:uracil phosphoribosyltransferase
MADGLLDLIPAARMGHVGLYRDHETKRPVEYFVKLPEPEGRIFIMVDPMLATGYSASAAVDVLNKRGVSDDSIRMMCLVAAPEGVRVLTQRHPTIPIYVAALDEKLNENAYIVPGLGDAGDRLFGTK